MGPKLLENIIAELNHELADGVISRAHQPDERMLIFRVYAKGKEARLLVSVDPEDARMHLTSRRHANPFEPKRFCSLLRSRINGARIAGFTQTSGERVCSMSLIRGRGEGKEAYTLVFELTGRCGNVILLDGAGKVVDAIRRYAPGESLRAVVAGRELLPLPQPEAPIGEDVWPQALQGRTWNEAVDELYSNTDALHEALLLRRSVSGALTNALKRSKRLLENLSLDLKKAEINIEAGRFGELLLPNLSRIKRGETFAECMDYTVYPSVLARVELDPKLSPKENAERYFKLAKKAKRACSIIAERSPKVEQEIEYIEATILSLSETESIEELSALEGELVDAGYVKLPADDDERKEKPLAEPVRKHLSSDGFEILCGKSGRGNDLIVKKYAKEGDLWLHVHNSPGAHVLVKSAGRKVTMTAISEAASIAALHSKLGKSAKVEVIYTGAGSISKPKGAKPGMVTVKEYKTIIVRPSVGGA